ncbi:MAG: GAF domain-containing protein [Chloroflexota bacterium]|nr:MAG: GAF domain-containing protein [Chloroflexota bacterium]
MSLRKLRWLAAILPIAVLAWLDYVRHFILPAYLHTLVGFVLTYVGLLLGVLVFSEIVFRLVERMQREIVEQNRKLSELYREGQRQAQQLRALHEAGTALTAELDLETVLQKVVDLSRDLVGAQYCALKVLDGEGYVGRFLNRGIDQETRERIGRLPEGRGVVGEVRRLGKPLRVADIRKHASSVGYPPHHPQMKTFLGVPIVSRNVVIGNLYLTDKHGGEEFTQQDEDAIVMLAAQAAIAIENARLYEQEQALAVLEERERIAQDLHDGIIQSLYAIGLNLEHVLDRAGCCTDEASERVTRSIEGLNGVIWDVRNYIFGLEPQGIQGQSLCQGLASLAREFRVNSLIDVDVSTDGEVDGLLPPDQVAHVFHIAREALSNVLKHAHATSVIISLTRHNDCLSLIIEDNGVGFHPASVVGNGRGLRNIAERAKAMHSVLSVHAAPQKGTKLELSIPVMATEEHA